MIEKVNPGHPDKVADRIAGALVDLAYANQNEPKVAIEVLIGHDTCTVIAESSYTYQYSEVCAIVDRIVGGVVGVRLIQTPQDKHLSSNQNGKIRCGDNGIFKGVPLTHEELTLSEVAHEMYKTYPFDGKYVLNDKKLIICQSNADTFGIETVLDRVMNLNMFYRSRARVINPLGMWSGGINVDTGATNRKLGSDMAQSVTGGGLHGKDLSKADVSVNIYAFLKAQQTQKVVELSCAIGDEYIDGLPYSAIVEIARDYIDRLGGFEKFAEWGLF